jgi:hypothetical protein
MLVYHAFAGAALTDSTLRRADAFDNAAALTQSIAHELSTAQEAGRFGTDLDPEMEASAILPLVLGLSLATLLEQMQPDNAVAILDRHLHRLTAETETGIP